MTLIGVDVHKSSSTARWLVPSSGESGRCRVDTTPKAFARLFERLPRPWVVAYEATRQAPAFTKLLREMDTDELHLVHPKALKALGSLQKAKTDDKDALLILSLLEAGMLPEAYLAPAPVQEWREVSRGRHALRQIGTQLQNHVRCLLNKAGLSCRGTRLLGVDGRKQVPELIGQLEPFAAIIGTMMWQVLLMITDFCRNLEELMKAELEAHPAGPALLKRPGLGVVTAFGIVAEIGEIERFSSVKRLHSYAGLVPKVSQSDDFYRVGRLSKDCNKGLRFLAVCGAQGATRCKGPNPAKTTYLRVKRNDPKRANTAKIAAARKVLTDVFWIWKEALARAA